MERLMLFLSGEHPTLPTSEAIAAIKAEHRAYKVIEQLDQVLIADSRAEPGVLAARLGMCREICWHLCTSNVDEVLDAVSSSDIVDLVRHGQTFAVRIKRVKRHSPDVNVVKLSGEIADLLTSEVDFRVDLVKPDVEILGVLTDSRCVIGVTAAKVDRTQFNIRRPTMRAAFHPGTLMPLLARCMVNLARTPRKGTLLDPFCGVGGILVEAGLIGARPIGVDIDREMIEGARRNLETSGIADYQLMVGDARHLPMLQVDAIATDPPFGRAVTTGGVPVDELYRQALPSVAGVLKRKGYICIASPAGIELEKIAEVSGLRLIERHEQRVHKSLTRIIYVFRRK